MGCTTLVEAMVMIRPHRAAIMPGTTPSGVPAATILLTLLSVIAVATHWAWPVTVLRECSSGSFYQLKHMN